MTRAIAVACACLLMGCAPSIPERECERTIAGLNLASVTPLIEALEKATALVDASGNDIATGIRNGIIIQLAVAVAEKPELEKLSGGAFRGLCTAIKHRGVILKVPQHINVAPIASFLESSENAAREEARRRHTSDCALV